MKLFVLTLALISHQAFSDINQELKRAVYAGNTSLIGDLLDKGADPNLYIESEHSYWLVSLLKYAVQNNYIELIQLLLDHKANIINLPEDSALHEAVIYNKPEIIKLFLQYGADPNAQAMLKDTSLHIATLKNLNNIVQLLLQHGANPNIQNAYGYTPIYWAISERNKPTIELLINYDADLTVVDNKGNTPVKFALLYGYKDIANFLEHGPADVAEVEVQFVEEVLTKKCMKAFKKPSKFLTSLKNLIFKNAK